MTPLPRLTHLSLPVLLLALGACGGGQNPPHRPSYAMRLEEIVDLAAEAVSKSGSDTTTVYLLQPGGTLPPGRVARIGGDPIGVDGDSWPRLDGKPMDHLVTLDLDELPALRTGPLTDARAVALFIGDRILNEAYLPGTPDSAVVVLSEADVGRGATESLRSAGAPATSLEVTTVQIPTEVFTGPLPSDETDVVVKLWEKLFDFSAYAGGQPLWLQGEDHQGHFIFQFDEGFIDLNLGDAGVMYAFADTAFWQCH